VNDAKMALLMLFSFTRTVPQLVSKVYLYMCQRIWPIIRKPKGKRLLV